MAKFLIKYEAVVGRTKADGGILPPVDLTFYNIIDATNREQVDELVVQYKDPGFVTRVTDVTELSAEYYDNTPAIVLQALQTSLIKEQSN